MAYADFAFYTQTYGGSSIPEDQFDHFAASASAYLDCLTLFRAAEYPDLEPLQLACCAVADQEFQDIQRDESVTREDNDGLSISYASPTERRQLEEENRYLAARRYLLQTGLMYRGVDG